MSEKYYIRYIRPEITPVEIPPYRGQRYDDMVPDTFDIHERLALAVNGVTGPTDPEADFEPYFWANFFHEPPVMTHSIDETQCQTKLMESLALLRIATGSGLNDHVDRAWRNVILKSIGPDGLYYMPMVGTPWARLNNIGEPWGMNVYRRDGTLTTVADPSVTQLTSVFTCSRLLGTLTLYWLREGEPQWKELLDRMVERLAALAIDRRSYSYYPFALYEPNARVADEVVEPISGEANFDSGRLIQGLVQFYRASGSETARSLAERLSRFIRRNSFGPEGQLLATRVPREGGGFTDTYGGHFHCSVYAALCLAEYGAATSDRDLLDFVRRSYEWAREQGCARVGFFPTMINPDPDFTRIHSRWYDEHESCQLADMIAIAIKLSAAGVGDYWDDVERWTRNHFAEGQLTSIDWIGVRNNYSGTRPILANETSERVGERNRGAFGGWMSGNDWALRMGIMHCCTGNATRTLYYLWEHMVRCAGGELRVNLRMNHASPWADVYGYEPYEGRVDVRMRQGCGRVLVHAPEWVKAGSEEVEAEVGGERRRGVWEGRYVDVGGAAAGQTVTVRYPMGEQLVREQLGDAIYTLGVKGSTVVSIDPKGRHCPLYQREHYRQNEVRWRKVKRFAPERRIEW